jgi:hypothetical protein
MDARTYRNLSAQDHTAPKCVHGLRAFRVPPREDGDEPLCTAPTTAPILLDRRARTRQMRLMHGVSTLRWLPLPPWQFPRRPFRARATTSLLKFFAPWPRRSGEGFPRKPKQLLMKSPGTNGGLQICPRAEHALLRRMKVVHFHPSSGSTMSAPSRACYVRAALVLVTFVGAECAPPFAKVQRTDPPRPSRCPMAEA